MCHCISGHFVYFSKMSGNSIRSFMSIPTPMQKKIVFQTFGMNDGFSDSFFLLHSFIRWFIIYFTNEVDNFGGRRF